MLTSVDSRPSAGALLCGIAHVIMIISAIPSIIQAGHAIGPFPFPCTCLLLVRPYSSRTLPPLFSTRMAQKSLSTLKPVAKASCFGFNFLSILVPSSVLLLRTWPSTLASGLHTSSRVSSTSCSRFFCGL
jgi:hypothetical protein